MNEEKKLLCPLDGVEMEQQEHGYGHYHACLSCRGLWIPRTYLLALKRRAAQQIKRSRVELIDAVSHAGTLKCPQCSGALLHRTENSVPIDICASCLALWLDGDEIFHIARDGLADEKKREERKRRQAGAPVMVTTSGPYVGPLDADIFLVDAVFETLNAVTTFLN